MGGVDFEVRAGMRLALIAAIQILPTRRRAVLLLRDVLDFSAGEVAARTFDRSPG
jgi:RNA polymerase sigma-70 factor (ECF subfamily)